MHLMQPHPPTRGRLVTHSHRGGELVPVGREGELVSRTRQSLFLR